MITILVTTDFSANAHWVTDYALALARQLPARLVLTHFYDPVADKTPPLAGLKATFKTNYYTILQQLYRVRSQMVMATDGSVSIAVLGQCYTVTNPSKDTVVNPKADLLIVGLDDLASQQNTQLGLLTRQPKSFTQLPILLVPPSRIYQTPKTIELVVSLAEPLHAYALGTILWLTRLFRASLDVICLVENIEGISTKETSSPIRNFLGNQLHSIRFMSNQDLKNTLENYLTQLTGNWIVLIPGILQRLLPILAASSEAKMAH
ncbi:universal stress protein [Spirosoma litoris]